MDTNVKYVSSTLRELRKREGITMAELAARVGTSEASISRWERGLNRPFGYWIRRLAAGLGVDDSRVLDALEVPKAS